MAKDYKEQNDFALMEKKNKYRYLVDKLMKYSCLNFEKNNFEMAKHFYNKMIKMNNNEEKYFECLNNEEGKTNEES